MEQLENFIRILLGLSLSIGLILCFRKTIRLKWPLIVTIIILLIKVLDVFLIKLISLENLIFICSSNLILAPIAYLYLISLKKGKLSKRAIILHLILPLIITMAMLYNAYFSNEENIMLTIITNLISAIIVLIYGLMIMFKSQAIYKIVGNGIQRSFYAFSMFLSLFFIIDSLVSIVSVLYFSDDLLLVNLSVNVPKTYDAHFYFTLLVMLCITSIYHLRERIKE